MRTRARRFTVGLVAALALSACSSKKKPPREDDEPKRPSASASAKPDAPPKVGQTISADEIVDENYRFRLKRPDATWVLAGEEEAAKVAITGSRAAFFGPQRVSGWVNVDPSRELGVSTQVDQMVRLKSASTGFNVELRGETTIDGKKAERIAFVSVEASGPRRECDVLFEHQGYTYVIGGAEAATPTSQPGCGFLEPMIAGFHVDDGDLVPRAPVVPKGDVIAAGYRLTGDVFESAAGGFRLRAGPSAPLVAGRDAQQYYGQAQVAVLYTSPAAVLTLRADVSDLDGLTALKNYESQLTQMIGAVDSGRTTEGRMLGAHVTLHQMNSPGFEWSVGLVEFPSRRILIAGFTPTGTRDAAEKAYLDTLANIEEMPKDDVASVSKALDEAPVAGNFFSATESFRNGTYRNFQIGLRWKAPSNAWNIHAGKEASDIDENALVTGRHVHGDIQCSLKAFQRSPNETFHKTFRDTFPVAGVRWGDPKKIPFDGGDAIESTGTATIGSKPIAYRVTTRQYPVANVLVICAATPPALAGYPDALNLFAAGVHGDLALPRTNGTNELTDQQLGYAFRLSSSWTVHPSGTYAERSALASDGSRFAEALAFASDPHWTSSYAVGLALRSEFDLLGFSATDDAPVMSDMVLDGHPATKFVFQPSNPGAPGTPSAAPIECASFSVDHIRYAIVARGDGAFAEAAAGFKLLDD